MQATIVTCRNPFHPALDRDVRVLRTRRRTIASLTPKTSLPFICLLNGDALPRDDWQRMVKHGDIVTFVTLPQGGGGGGSNPLQMVAMIALTYFTVGAGAALWQGAYAGTFTGAMMGAGAMMVGTSLINALLPPPRPPSPQTAASMAAPSPTYSLSAQGNAARLGAAIPVQYGRHIAFPDFAADPYAEFVGNEQFVYQLMVIGQGEYDIEAVRMVDTPVANFEEITYEIIQPGGTVSLFPSNVSVSVEVAGAEALTGVYLGPFVANASGTLANFIAIDIACPKGLYYATDTGALTGKSITFTVEAQAIDANGVATAGWIPLGTETISAATNTPQRRSYRYPVSQARYQVRLKRTDVKDTSSRAGHDLNWAGLRAYLPGSQQYGNLTLIAMRMKASNNLSQAATRKVNVICTRKLPIWNPATGWSAPIATRSIAWALADACRADYGAKHADAQLDLAQLYALDQIWTARGDTFDGRFDNTLTFWEAVTQIGRAGRAKPYSQGGLIHVVRDQAQTIPVALFSPRNTLKGSLKIDYLMPVAETADAVIIQYFDSVTWNPAEVTAALPGSIATNPAKVQLFGCTSRAQAWREGMYMAACNRYRRKPIVLSTEMEGFIPSFGDLVAVSSERLTHAQSGEVVDWNASTLILTLSEPITWKVAAQHYFGLRRRDGSFSGPWLAMPGMDEYHAQLAGVPDITPYTGNNEERTHFTFGIGTEYRQLALLKSAKPRGHQVELSLINDDPLVHLADMGAVPAPLAEWQLVKVPTAPMVSGLTVVQGGTPAKPVLSISWQPAAGSDHYLIEQSGDGISWTRAGDTTSSSLSIDVQPGMIYIRVAGIGLTRGAWASWFGNAGTAISQPPDITGLALSEAFTGTTCNIKWDIAARSISYTVEVWANSLLKRSRTVTSPSFSYSVDDAKADGGPWRNLTFKVVANGSSSSQSPAVLTVSNPQIGPLNNVTVTGLLASLVVDYPRPAAADFSGICVWVSTIAGFTPDASNLKYDGPNNLVNIDLNPGNTQYHIRVAGYDVWGKDSLAISPEISATTTLILATHIADGSIETPKLAANSITADKVSINNLSAISANLGSITAGSININNRFMVDAAGNMTATSGAFSGVLSAATGSFSGLLSGADISGATGTFGGMLSAGTLTSITQAPIIYTVPGTYTITVPVGYTSVRISLQGGGGGGGGGADITRSGTGGGGGGGAAITQIFNGLTEGATYTVTVGAGGVGGSIVDFPYQPIDSNSTLGGATYIVGLLTAGGGGPGLNPFSGANGSGIGLGGAAGGVGATAGGTGDGGSGNCSSGASGNYPGIAAGVYGYIYRGWRLPTPSGYGAGGAGGGYGIAQTGGNGAGGYAKIEFFSPNAVVLQSEYALLIAQARTHGWAI